MSVYNGVDGQTLSVTQEFLDDNEVPLIPKPGYPIVKLMDKQKATLSSIVCTPSAMPGTWNASLAVPQMGLEEKTEFVLVWRLTTPSGDKYKYTDTVLLEPKVDSRDSDVVAVFGDLKFSFTLPMVFDEASGDTGVYQIWASNNPVVGSNNTLESNPGITITKHLDKTTFTVPMCVPNASLFSNLLKVDVLPANGQYRSFIFKLWAVTPQILLGMSFLEDFLNKSRIENVIPELRYVDGDLLNYLERGLYLFNMAGQASFFDGTNMTGILFDAWVTCSAYYAISAQILAEGSLAFDFSGQGISLNVDRTPQLDAALGRLQGDIDNRIVPLKKLLAKNGTIYGTGVVGNKGIDNATNVGVLSMMNAPTTRLPRFSQMFVGRRG